MAKTVNHSKSSFKEPSIPSWYERILNDDGLCFFPGKSDEEQDRLWTYRCMQYADQEKEAFTIIKFCRLHKISKDDWDTKLASPKYPRLQKWHKAFKQYLADNRYNGALKRELDKELAMQGIIRLDPDFKEDLEYMAELKKKTEPVASNEDKNITITNQDNGYKTKEPSETL
jgi:hypothetical protein